MSLDGLRLIGWGLVAAGILSFCGAIVILHSTFMTWTEIFLHVGLVAVGALIIGAIKIAEKLAANAASKEWERTRPEREARAARERAEEQRREARQRLEAPRQSKQTASGSSSNTSSSETPHIAWPLERNIMEGRNSGGADWGDYDG